MRILLALFLLGSAAYANTSTVTGTIKDAQGNPINGTLVMRLPVPAQDPTTHTAIAPIPVTFQLVNGAVTGGAPLYDLATIQPSKLWYSARAYDTTGALVFFGNYFVTGSTFNIGTATPTVVTTSNISYANLIAGLQSINGDTTQAQTIAGSGTITVSTSAGKTTIGGGSGSVGVATFAGVSDAKFDTTCSTTNNSNLLTCSDAPFAPCPPTGSVVSVTGGALDGGSNVVSLITTITGCTSSSVATMAANSTHTITPSPGTRWGTDNFPALKAQYATAIAAGNKTFVIPGGNYLINTPAGTQWALASGTEIIFQKGATVFWVGPVGSPAIEGGVIAIDVPNGTSNVHIRIDGIINGDNVSGGPGVPNLNQSRLIFIDNGFSAPINNINIDGSGLIENIYGFDVQSLATPANASGDINFSGLRISVSGKGTNISSIGRQTNLYLFKSFGMETATPGAIIANNTFDASGGISLGGNSGTCAGNVIANNSFLNTTRLTNLFIADCINGATITGNTFYVAAGNIGISMGATAGFSSTGGNIIANNTFTCGSASPSQAFAAIYSAPSANTTPGNFYYNNMMINDPSVANSFCNFGVEDDNNTSTDTFIGGFYTNGGLGIADFNINSGRVLAINVQTTGNGPIFSSGTLDPKSSFLTPSGILSGSGLGTSFSQASASLTTTAATSDNVSITGVTSGTGCALEPTNASAATNVATTYVSAKTTNQITVTHTATSGMTYDIQCFIK